jgi:RHH-type rel operon transcriptional repressor/antitoxin RelB
MGFDMTTSIRLTPETEQRLNSLATMTGRSKAFYLRELIERGLDELEALYIAEQRLIDLKAGRSKTVPLEEVMKRYDMAD